jgi:flagellar biosynthesis protein FliR
MENKPQTTESRWPAIEEGIVMGIMFGFTYGLIFMDGNILLGMILGMLAGLTISSIFAARQGRQKG